MTIEEMKQRKQELGYTHVMISDLSGVPLGTVQKIFSGETSNPRYDTLLALERVLRKPYMVMDSVQYTAEARHLGPHTLADYYALPDDQRVELIDGVFYDMSAPTTVHQLIAGDVYRQIANYIYDRNGVCTPLISPVDVQLDCDDKTMVQPDVVIVCDKGKVIRRCVYGAPDFVLEVVSPTTRRKDCTKKLAKYTEAGVREYWILDPYQKKLLIYDFESEVSPRILGLDEPVPVGIYKGELVIQMKRIHEWVEEWEESGAEP